MAIKQHSSSMLRRLADKGFPVDFGALDALFNLTITSVASIDIDASPIIKFSQRVRALVRESGFDCQLSDIAVFLMILNPELRSAKDSVSWKRGSRSYSIRRNISFSQWQRAKSDEKKEILVNCVIDSIMVIPTKHLDQSSKDALITIVRQAIRPATKTLRA